MGVGKSHVMQWAGSKGYFPLSSFLHLDSDLFRTRLREYRHDVCTVCVKTDACMHREREGGRRRDVKILCMYE
jgi:hypothetical protein